VAMGAVVHVGFVAIIPLTGLGSRAKLISLDSGPIATTGQVGDGGASSFKILRCCCKFTYELCALKVRKVWCAFGLFRVIEKNSDSRIYSN
jgi:hypothetical protein